MIYETKDGFTFNLGALDGVGGVQEINNIMSVSMIVAGVNRTLISKSTQGLEQKAHAEVAKEVTVARTELLTAWRNFLQKK